MIFYDDMHQTDLASRDLLLYRLQRQHEAGAAHLLVLAVQTEALATAPELEGLARRAGAPHPDDAADPGAADPH